MEKIMSSIPEALFDGQIFIDTFRVKWIYSSKQNSWMRQGRIDAIPTADGTNVGLLTKDLKTFLDKIDEKGGGFAIITSPLLTRRTGSNPDGVLFGSVELISESLNLDCVGASGTQFAQIKPCERNCFTEGDKLPPGFDFSLSDKFWASMCGVNVPGGPGLPGPEGDKGDPGVLGTGDGPVGLQGDPGRDATYRLPITGVKLIDTEDIFDAAVVKLELDQPNGVLFVTKAKTLFSDALVADQVIARQISRSIKFGTCWEYEIIMDPCVAGDDFDVLDPLIAYLPEHFVPGNCDTQVRGYQPVRAKFSNLIDRIINVYRTKLQDEAKRIDGEISDFITGKDTDARNILSDLTDRLAECENITYLDYCIGIGPPCNISSSSSGGGGGESSSSSSSGGGGSSSSSGGCSPDASQLEIIRFVGCSDNSCVTNLGERTLSLIPLGAQTQTAHGPVYAFNMPDPSAYASQNPPGANCGTNSQDYVNQLVAALANGVVVYDMIQILKDATTYVFQPGTYVFVYKNGGFFQYPLRDIMNVGTQQNPACMSETLDLKAADFLQGGFRKCYVGNEGNGGSLLLSMQNFCTPTGPLTNINAPLISTAIGVDIGVAPVGYNKPWPSDYFDPFVIPSSSTPPSTYTNYPTKHGTVETFEAGVVRCNPNDQAPTSLYYPAGFFPNPRIDFGKTDSELSSLKSALGQVVWTSFPATPSGSSYAQSPQLICNQKDQYNRCYDTVTDDQVRSQIGALQAAYYEGAIGTRAVKVVITQPSTVWMRCKLAYNVPNPIGQLIMPQSKRTDQYSLQQPGNLFKSFNGAMQKVTKRGTLANPIINAQPAGFGATTFLVYQVDCK
jgi:hypothetical protein